MPVENLVGEENKGWTYAKFLLGHERTNIAGIGTAKRELARLKRIAAQRDQERASADRTTRCFAARIAQIEIDLTALEITNLRVLSAEAREARAGAGSLDPEDQGHRNPASDHANCWRKAVGPYALPLAARGDGRRLPGRAGAVPPTPRRWPANYLNMRKLSIYGGSNEIQKNIIAK